MKGTRIGRRGILSAAAAAALAWPISTAEGADAKKRGTVDAKGVGAVEDLMRQHGLLRRCFLAYRECAGRLRIDPARVDAAALNETAKLIRSFGEDYHEKKLEEAHIFPRVRQLLPGVAASVDTLILQHARGREITTYIMSVTGSAKIAAADAEPLARAFDAFEVMYANHAAREDSIVYPKWKSVLSAPEIAQIGDEFENIERAELGADGFQSMLRRMADIEERLGLIDLAQFTALPPPHEIQSSP